jgi:hypothetical protein
MSKSVKNSIVAFVIEIARPYIVFGFLGLSLLACAAKNPPHQIQITVPDNYSGTVRVVPCQGTTPSTGNSTAATLTEPLTIYASACPNPGEQIELLVTRAGTVTRIMPENLSVARTGDGIPVEVSAHVP